MSRPTTLAMAVIALGTSGAALGQTISVSCPEFFQDRHQAISCVEAIFTQDHYHFTLAALPPSNGFGPGLVLVKTIRGTTTGQPARGDGAGPKPPQRSGIT